MKITKSEAQAFQARWPAVNEAELEELRRTPPEVKLQQMNALYALSQQAGWTEALAGEEDDVRELWNRLRRAYGV